MENLKYEILQEKYIKYNGIKLYRIQALKDFGDVKKGDIGGYVKSYDNLSQEGNCWVFGNAKVYENAYIYGNAYIYENARVYGNAKVYGTARVYENVCVYGNAEIYGNAVVCENQHIQNGAAKTDLTKDIKENIRCQTGLGVFNNKVIAYKQVKKDLTSFYDNKFKYEVGKVVKVENPDMSKESCASGLHFSNMNYWNSNKDILNSTFLMAEIDIKDVITVQEGKIRCKKAKILGSYNIGE